MKAEDYRLQPHALGTTEEGSSRLAEALSCCALCWMIAWSKLPLLLPSQSLPHIALLDLPYLFGLFPSVLEHFFFLFIITTKEKKKKKKKNHLMFLMFATAANSAYILHAFPLHCIVYLNCKLWTLFLGRCYANNGERISVCPRALP